VHKVVQRLPVGCRHEAGELDERLVVLAGQEQPNQEQPNQVLAQRAPFLVATKEVVEGSAKRVNCRGGRWGRWSVGSASVVGASPELLSRTHTGLAPSLTHLTNQRLVRNPSNDTSRISAR
jgi:hypothetical protein